ncbi:MAG: AAA family ATPase [Candidatus Jorgensenbacteria bacterium]|nr:AAA family ATPase [Candidatus Jorgensenbacteria bacterium]
MASNFLRRLELQGFKSFALKTVLEFPERVVAIVGPNGSGKSNLIDALRWVLGEREAKQLRGDTLGNLIFGGTTKRAAVSLARVALHFDNRNGTFPIDAPEVELSRKIDRSGVSEFYLHDSEIKLKDLVPMLARARLGARGLTMIGQGQSDMFVKSSSTERREMIEEVLGLREYRIKKNQAERRLEASSANMDKVRALIEEIAPHLRLLLKQKHRWNKRSEIADELKALETNYFGFRYHALRSELHELEKPLHALDAELRGKHEQVAALEKHAKEEDAKAFDAKRVTLLREGLTKLFEERADTEKKLIRLEAQAEITARASHTAQQPPEAYRSFISELSGEIDAALRAQDFAEVKEKLHAWAKKIKFLLNPASEIETKSDDSENEIKKLKAALHIVDKEIIALRAEEDAILTSQRTMHAELRSRFEALEKERESLRKLEEKARNFQFELEKAQLKIGDVERDWRALGKPVSALEELPKSAGEIDVADAERRMLRLRGELAAIGEIDDGMVKEADETEKRHEFLTAELSDLEKATKDLTGVIRELEEKIHDEFKSAFHTINKEFNNYFQLMFGGGKAKLALVKKEPAPVLNENDEVMPVIDAPDADLTAGVEIDLNLPRRKITNLDMLSGGEKSLVSLAALFSLIAVSPPPFLVLDEIDAALDEDNARRFSELVKSFSQKTQFIIITHNRSTMEVADILYGITMGEDGISKVLSLKLS